MSRAGLFLVVDPWCCCRDDASILLVASTSVSLRNLLSFDCRLCVVDFSDFLGCRTLVPSSCKWRVKALPSTLILLVSSFSFRFVQLMEKSHR